MMYPRLKDMRSDAKLTQKEVAAKLNMSQTGYSKYETGENDVPSIVLIKLAKLYETSVDYLLGLTNNPVLLRLLYFPHSPSPETYIPSKDYPAQNLPLLRPLLFTIRQNFPGRLDKAAPSFYSYILYKRRGYL